MNTQLFQSLAISLLLGGLVGLQRQHVDSPLGGVRTFPLVTIFGSLCAILAGPFGDWMVAVGLLATIAVIALGSRQVRSEADRGLISSAATTASYARRSAEQPAMVPAAATVICLATGVSFVRILLEVAVVSRTLLPAVAPPLIGLMIVSLLFALLFGLRGRQPSETMPS